MKILALEFSSSQRSVAVVCAEAGGEPSISREVIETSGRGTNTIGLLEEVLRQAKLEREQIDCLAIGLGPGSYTGIRAAIALAQGWQLAARPGGLKLLGVSSAECLAEQARAEGSSGRVHVVIDAQREELYLATYEINQAACREIAPLEIVTLAGARARAQAGDVFIGPEVTRWFPGGRVLLPRALMISQLAAHRNDFVTGENLKPIYLRETSFVKAPPSRIIP
jgi:tRNA threonylcarbamoyl adenosine modification protein YeaZ